MRLDGFIWRNNTKLRKTYSKPLKYQSTCCKALLNPMAGEIWRPQNFPNRESSRDVFQSWSCTSTNSELCCRAVVALKVSRESCCREPECQSWIVSGVWFGAQMHFPCHVLASRALRRKSVVNREIYFPRLGLLSEVSRGFRNGFSADA